MTIKEFIKRLEEFPEDTEIKVGHIAGRIGLSFVAEPILMRNYDKVLILSGKLEAIPYAQH